LIPEHTASDFGVEISTTLNEYSLNEAAGLFNFELIPVAVDSTALIAVGSGTGTYKNGVMKFGGSVGTDDWRGLALGVANICGQPVMTSKGYQGFYAWANKTITDLPPQFNEVLISFILDVTHLAGLGTATVYMNGIAVRVHQFVASKAAGCPQFVKGERRATVELAVAAGQTSLSLAIGFEGGYRNVDPSLGVFAISQFAVSARVAGRAPWRAGPADFAAPGFDGWFFSGASVAMTTCDEGSVMLGGHNMISAGIIQKTFTAIPTHAGLILLIEPVFVNSWAGEKLQILIDGLLHYERQFGLADAPEGDIVMCNDIKTFSDPVTILLQGHTDPEVTIAIQTQLDQQASNESFGIAGVVVIPLTAEEDATNGLGLGSWQAGPAQFGHGLDGLDGFAGDGVSPLTCEPGKNTVLNVKGVYGLIARAYKEFTGLPQHYALQFMAVLHPTTDQLANGKARARVEIMLDSAVIYEKVRRVFSFIKIAIALPPACRPHIRCIRGIRGTRSILYIRGTLYIRGIRALSRYCR